MKIDIKQYLNNKIVIASSLAALSLLSVVGYLIFSEVEKELSDEVRLQSVSFSSIEEWQNDQQAETLAAFMKSCGHILKITDKEAPYSNGQIAGKAGDWKNVCSKLDLTKKYDDKEARAFFEDNFTPYAIWGKKGRDGLFTGYYEPTLHGSFTKHGKFNTPIYGLPTSMISVNLGDFRPELKGQQIVGRVEGQKLIPYFNREQIDKGALTTEKAEIVWVDNPVDAFFLHIQGSGRVVMENGEIVRVGYLTQNGLAYTAIGGPMEKAGYLQAGNVSMQTIRAWLEKNPEKAPEVMDINKSYIFFRVLDVKGDGPLGAEGISLTAERSMAIDKKKLPYGAPIWLDTEKPGTTTNERMRRLMVAQDTGGAINGAVRGDFFWGAGDKAAENAGLMKSKGQAWILLPKTVTVPEDKLKKRFELW